MSTATLTEPATWHKDDARNSRAYDTLRNERIQQARDAKPCACGHLNVSHAYGAEDGPTWPDGSRIGRGACGIDRDTRNAATGWIGDPCPCAAFEEAAQ